MRVASPLILALEAAELAHCLAMPCQLRLRHRFIGFEGTVFDGEGSFQNRKEWVDIEVLARNSGYQNSQVHTLVHAYECMLVCVYQGMPLSKSKSVCADERICLYMHLMCVVAWGVHV